MSGEPAAQADVEPTIAESLAGFAAGLRFEDVPDEVIARAKLHILDTLGTALAAAACDFAESSLAGVRALSAGEGEGRHPVIGMKARLPLRDAVLINGILAHGLDYDDTHPGGVIHASTSAVPAVLGAGARADADGRAALLAYLIAIEADARLGVAAKGGFHLKGFHPTGMLGVFGCALAAGRLDGLDAAALARAQGIALSFASGSFEFLEEGAWTKRAHPGWAGVGGITAASLAGAGFEAPSRPYEGRFGIYHSYLDADAEVDLDACTAGLGEVWEMLDVALKPYPICHFNHAFADAALALMADHGLRADDVMRATGLIAQGSVDIVCEPLALKHQPANDYDARFSMPYTVAATLVRGHFTLAELEADALADPAIGALCRKIGYAPDPESGFPEVFSGELVVETRDGRTLRHREQVNRGARGRALGEAEVMAKFFDNAARRIARDRAEAIAEAVMGLDSADARLGTLLERLDTA